jgi:hypothetical protein
MVLICVLPRVEPVLSFLSMTGGGLILTDSKTPRDGAALIVGNSGSLPWLLFMLLYALMRTVTIPSRT